MKKKKGLPKSNPLSKHNKDKNIFNNSLTQRIFESLLQGNKHTTLEGGNTFKTSDFRSHIRVIRNNGYVVSDYWENDGSRRYKVYFFKA